MGFEVKVTGGADLRSLQNKLRAVGGKGLGKQMGKALREAAEPLRPAVKSAAIASMPSGYGPVLSRSLRFRRAIKETAHTAHVTVRVYGDGRQERRDVPRLNKGRLRHPLYGNRNLWFDQAVKAGFVDRPFNRLKPGIAREMQSVIDHVAQQIGA